MAEVLPVVDIAMGPVIKEDDLVWDFSVPAGRAGRTSIRFPQPFD